MKKNHRTILTALALILTLSLSFTAIASARSASAPTGASGDEIIDRGVAWELLNSQYYAAQDLLSEVGNDFTDQYRAALRNYCDAAQRLLDSTASTIAELTQMTDDLNYLIGERLNPANRARFGCYTVAFTNNGSWSEPIYLYNWSDDGGELQPFPGAAMRGGYINEFGQMQYYAFVPMDIPNIVISTDQLRSDDPDHGVPCVRVQTVDIFVSGNTGYYLTGARDGKGNCKVATWELKAPQYQLFDTDDPVPTEPSTDAPPTQQQTQTPTQQPTQQPTVKPADPATEPPTEFNIDDYIARYAYDYPICLDAGYDAVRQQIYDLVGTVDNMFAPGSNYPEAYSEKVHRLRNFAVSVYNDDRSADHELTGALKMLQAAVDDKSYEEIVAIMRQWFNMPSETPDPTAPQQIPTDPPTDPDPIWNHLVGDADGDGAVTILDATCVQRVLVGFDTAKKAMAQRYACITGNELSILDATAIQRYLVGYADNYGVGGYFLPTGLK